MGEWKTKIGDTVDIGQELGTLFTEEESLADQFEAAAEVSATRKPVEAAVSGAGPGDGDRGRIAPETVLKKPGSAIPAAAIEPALSPTVNRKLSRVIPANLQIGARWDASRDAHELAKKEDGENAPSPSRSEERRVGKECRFRWSPYK